MCPVKVLSLSEVVGEYGNRIPEPVKQDECIGCNICVLYCPDYAIGVQNIRETRENENRN